MAIADACELNAVAADNGDPPSAEDSDRSVAAAISDFPEIPVTINAVDGVACAEMETNNSKEGDNALDSDPTCHNSEPPAIEVAEPNIAVAPITEPEAGVAPTESSAAAVENDDPDVVEVIPHAEVIVIDEDDDDPIEIFDDEEEVQDLPVTPSSSVPPPPVEDRERITHPSDINSVATDTGVEKETTEVQSSPPERQDKSDRIVISSAVTAIEGEADKEAPEEEPSPPETSHPIVISSVTTGTGMDVENEATEDEPSPPEAQDNSDPIVKNSAMSAMEKEVENEVTEDESSPPVCSDPAPTETAMECEVQNEATEDEPSPPERQENEDQIVKNSTVTASEDDDANLLPRSPSPDAAQEADSNAFVISSAVSVSEMEEENKTIQSGHEETRETNTEEDKEVINMNGLSSDAEKAQNCSDVLQADESSMSESVPSAIQTNGTDHLMAVDNVPNETELGDQSQQKQECIPKESN